MSETLCRDLVVCFFRRSCRPKLAGRARQREMLVTRRARAEETGLDSNVIGTLYCDLVVETEHWKML